MRRLALILALAAACGSGDQKSAPSQTAEEMIAAELPGMRVGLDSGVITDSAFTLRTFNHRSTLGERPSGGGIAIFTRGGKLAWLHLTGAEVAPHSIGLGDFDKDGRTDIIYYAGHEEIFVTQVILNRMARDGFAVSNFSLDFRDDNAYDPILDFDGDGKPELLIPRPRAEDDEDRVGPTCSDSLYEGTIRDEVTREYYRLAGRFDSTNFRYGVAAYPLMNMLMLDSIRIFSLAGSDPRAMKKYPKHLEWRIGILKRLRDMEGDECRQRFDALIAYLTDPGFW